MRRSQHSFDVDPHASCQATIDQLLHEKSKLYHELHKVARVLVEKDDTWVVGQILRVDSTDAGLVVWVR